MFVTKVKKAVLSLSALALMLTAGNALADYTLNMAPGVTKVSNQLYNLHMIIMGICTVVGIGVFSVMIYSIINHRKSKGAVASQFHENTTVEVIWTVIPLIILVAMAVPATKALLAYEDTSNADVTITATGYQWKWKYEYLNEDISFFSTLSTPRDQIENKATKGENYLLEVDNHVVVPVNKKIRILTTANDVIHAWWVPELGVKRDAIPGYINESHFTAEKIGVYRGQCAELCGKDHGFMPIVVEVVEEGEYKQWVARQQAAKVAAASESGKTFSKAELMARGEKVYAGNCAACHGMNGEASAPIFPSMKGGKIATGPIADHLSIVVHGSKKNPTMTAYGPQLNDADLAAVITYERNAFGNNTGDAVQPKQIKAAR